MSKKKELYNEIVKSKKIGELADKVNTLPDSIKVVCQTIDLTVKLCNEMDKRDHEKYLKKIQPLLIIVEDVNNQLKNENIGLLDRKELYVTLFEAQKKIEIAGQKNHNWKDIAIGTTIGAGIVGAVWFAVSNIPVVGTFFKK